MPTNGRATYRGVGAVKLGSEANGSPLQLYAPATVTADFNRRDIKGEMTNFKSDRGSVNGNIKVTGDISHSDIRRKMTGNLNLNGRNHSISDYAFGAFIDDDAEGVVIAGSGTTSRGAEYNAGIIAERDD